MWVGICFIFSLVKLALGCFEDSRIARHDLFEDGVQVGAQHVVGVFLLSEQVHDLERG